MRKRAKLVFCIDASCNSLLNSKADFINKHLISFGILEDKKTNIMSNKANVMCNFNLSIITVYLKSVSVFNLALTWNDWNCFQSSENSEGSQRWDIAQVHKLCHISVIGSSHTNTITGYKERAIGTRSLMLCTDHFLPGITEIVFKALKTLKVWTAEKLPRLTNSVTYL